jgi:hypothetical protein
MSGFLAAAIPLAFYLAWPSTFWNFDGVACAAALELGNPVYFFHAQHLTYGFFGFLFWKLLAPIGMTRALPALQIMNSFVAASALYFLWRLIKTLSGDAKLALILSSAAGVTAAFWVWSIEAQVYPLGVLGLAAASSALLAPDAKVRMKHIGFWHAFAVLGHVVHGLWIIPALYWIHREKLPLRPYLVTLIGIVGTAYGLVALFVLRPYQAGSAWFSHWVKGSLGLTADRSIAWHWPGWIGPWRWLHATPGVLWGTFWPYGGISIPWAIHAVSVLSQILLAVFLVLLWCGRKKQPMISFAALWLGVYALFFFTWEPETLCYRVTDILPFSLLVMMGLLAVHHRGLRLALAGSWMASLMLVNGWTLAIPMHHSERNHVYQQTVALARMTPDQSLYLTNGGLTWIYLLYFTGRSAWNVQNLSIEEFDSRWSTLTPRPALYVASGVLRDSQAAPWLERHHLKVIPELPWLEVS